MFIPDRIDRELHSLKCLDLKFGLSSEFSQFFDKITVRILLDVLLCVFRFSKASFFHGILKLQIKSLVYCPFCSRKTEL